MPARRALAGLLVSIVALGLAACTTSPPAPSPARPTTSAASPEPTAASSTSALVDAQTAMDRLFAAGVAGDRATWDAGVATLDAASAVRTSMLFANLHALRPARLQVRLTGTEQPVPADRRTGLGPGARIVQARLAWRFPGERADAVSSVWLTLVAGPAGERLAGTDDGTLDTPATPLWWLSPVTRVTRGDVTVLVGEGQAAKRWASLATRAAADTRTHLPAPLRRGWDGYLVVEVPGSETDFARVLGAAPSAYATTAAVTRPEGPTTGAALRVVVNPATAQDTDAELATTLVHETVHVATRSATSPAPLWAVEGLAEHVALLAHPDQRRDELAAVPGGEEPGRLPTDGTFTAGAHDVSAAYAQAWLACRAVAEHRGERRLGDFYAALDDGDGVEAAARSSLGVDDSTVVAWWRTALRRAAAGGRG